jgi:hypothetical protein
VLSGNSQIEEIPVNIIGLNVSLSSYTGMVFARGWLSLGPTALLADQTPSQFVIIADLPPILTFSGHTTTLANLPTYAFFAYQFSSAARGGNGRTVAITVGCYNAAAFNIPERRYSRYVTVKGVYNTDPFITCLQAVGVATVNYEIQGITGSNQCDYCEYAAFNCPLVTPTPNLACIDGYFQITTTAPPLTTAATTTTTTPPFTGTTAPTTAPVPVSPYPLYPLTPARIYISNLFQLSLNPDVIGIDIAGSSAPNETTTSQVYGLEVNGFILYQTIGIQQLQTFSPYRNMALVPNQIISLDSNRTLQFPLVLANMGYGYRIGAIIFQNVSFGYWSALAYATYNSDTKIFDTWFNLQVGITEPPTWASVVMNVNQMCFEVYFVPTNSNPMTAILRAKIPVDAVGFFCYWTSLVADPLVWTTPGPLPGFATMVDQFAALRNIPIMENVNQVSVQPAFIFSVNISGSELSGVIRTYYMFVYYTRFTQYLNPNDGYFSNETPFNGLFPATTLLGYPIGGTIYFTGNLATISNATIIAMKLKERNPSTGVVEPTIARVICYNINTGLMELSYEVRTGPQPYNNFFNCVHDVGRGVVYPPTINVTNHCGFCQYAVLYCTNVIAPATCAANYLS